MGLAQTFFIGDVVLDQATNKAWTIVSVFQGSDSPGKWFVELVLSATLHESEQRGVVDCDLIPSSAVFRPLTSQARPLRQMSPCLRLVSQSNPSAGHLGCCGETG